MSNNISNIVFCEGDNDLLFISLALGKLNIKYKPVKYDLVLENGKNGETKIIRQYISDNKSNDVTRRRKFLVKEENGKFHSMDNFVYHLSFDFKLLLVLDWDNGKTLESLKERLQDIKDYLIKKDDYLYTTKLGQRTFFVPTSLEDQINQTMHVNFDTLTHDEKSKIMTEFIDLNVPWVQNFFITIRELSH